jgi:hypothetical protein
MRVKLIENILHLIKEKNLIFNAFNRIQGWPLCARQFTRRDRYAEEWKGKGKTIGISRQNIQFKISRQNIPLQNVPMESD